MNTFEDGLKLISAQDEIICAAAVEQDRIKQEMVKHFCPVKIGDIVEVNSGYSYSGKKMQVDSIKLRKNSWRGADGFEATGQVLRKDGTPGAGRGEHFVKPA
jgi:hypothetical protein